MRKKLFALMVFMLLNGIASAGERVDVIGGDGDQADDSACILDASWDTVDPYGEFSSSLGAAAALNRALGLIFSGHASPEQIELERSLASEYSGDCRTAPFAVEILDRLQSDFADSFPQPVMLSGFDLEPSREPVISESDPHLVAIRYDGEEYLERLLQRLYFKLIQGPVLLTVAYRADAPGVPEEFRDWRNFRYGSNGTTMEWNDVRLVWVDWDLTQTVVLTYEDGSIACYDSGRKYYIDHTAAVAAAGAMMAHPDFPGWPSDAALNYVLTTIE